MALEFSVPSNIDKYNEENVIQAAMMCSDDWSWSRYSLKTRNSFLEE